MREFTFTLMLDDATEVAEGMEDRLFEAGCDDALLFSRDGHVYLDFTREAASQVEAVDSALRDVQKAGFLAKVTEEAKTTA
jgi:hypothetical protein